jgi:hypothetical protein
MLKQLSLMKAPGDKRPTWLNGIIQIHITRACDLSCIGCTQGSNLSGKPTMMTEENFRIACESLQNYFGVVGIFGGNPTMHPQFEKFSRILATYIPYERRGLWSNNLRGYGAICREIYNPAYSNLNVHTSVEAYEEMKRDWPECNPIGQLDSRHSPPYVALDDIKDLTNDDKWNLITKCDVNQLWSAMICQFRGEVRAFFCELAGAQSMLHENEINYPDTGLPVTNDWWQFGMNKFEHQVLKHCFSCGIPLKGKGDLAVNGTTEYVSKTHLNIYGLKKPKDKELKMVESLSDLNGSVNRATDYIANGVQSIMSNDVKIMIVYPTLEY